MFWGEATSTTSSLSNDFVQKKLIIFELDGRRSLVEIKI